MMKYILFFLLFFSTNLNTFCQVRVLTRDNKCRVSIFYSDSDYQDKRKLLEQINSFLSENYPKIDYPIYLSGWFDAKSSYSITFDGMYGSSLGKDKNELADLIKDNELNKPSIKIDIDLTDLENSLKVIEYGIKEKKALEKKFNKITKIIDKGKFISGEDEESIIIEEKDLQQILSKPPSKKVSAFMKNIQE